MQDGKGKGQGQGHQHEVVGVVMQHPEGREADDAQQEHADTEDLGLAVTVGELAPEGDGHGHDSRRHDEGGQRRLAMHAVLLGEVGQRVHAEDVEGNAVEEARAHAGQHHLGILLEDFDQGELGFGSLGLGFGEVLGFLHGHTHVGTDDEQHGAQDEGHAPAPAQEGFGAENGAQQSDDAGGQQQADGHADLGQAAVEGALGFGSGFKGHEHRAAPFAAKADTLKQTADDEQNRGPDADGFIGGDQADADRGRTHDFQRQNEHLLAAQLVAEVPEDDAAQRTGHKAHGKGGKGQHGADAGVKVGEIELVEEQAGNNAVQEEVVPFNDGPQHGRNDHAAQVLLLVQSLFIAHARYPVKLEV